MARRHKLLGNVELLGLNAFGGEISPLWGTIIGGSVAGLTNLTLSQYNNGANAQNKELYGFLAGLGSAGIMFAMPSTKKAAFGAVIGAFLGSGLSWVEKMIFGTVQVAATTAQAATAIVAANPAAAQAAVAASPPATSPMAGLGIARVHALNGLGLRRQPGGHYLNDTGGGMGIARVHALNGGLGLATIAAQPQSRGTIPGVHGPSFAGMQLGARAPVSLLGTPSTRSNQISLMGGPQIHGLSSAYGATLLGGR